MRIIFNPKTGNIKATINERVTSHIPKSYVGSDSEMIDIDYDNKNLAKSKFLRELDKDKSILHRKRIVLKEGKIKFEDRAKECSYSTVIADVQKPKFHKDIGIYTDKAKEAGAKVQIIQAGDGKIVIIIRNRKGKRVGDVYLKKINCCTYRFERGKVNDRNYYPHYIGLYKAVEYLRGLGIEKLDIGGMTKDEDLNRFKRKWGKEIGPRSEKPKLVTPLNVSKFREIISRI